MGQQRACLVQPFCCQPHDRKGLIACFSELILFTAKSGDANALFIRTTAKRQCDLQAETDNVRIIYISEAAIPFQRIQMSTSTDRNINIIKRRNSALRQALRVSNEYSLSDDETSTKGDGKSSKRRGKLTSRPTLEGEFEQGKTEATPEEVNVLVSSINKRKPLRKPQDEFVSKYRDVKLRETSLSILDSEEFKSLDYYGCYIIFWMATGYLIFAQLMHFSFENHELPWSWPIVQTFRKDIFKVALTDLAMYLMTYMAYIVQRLVKAGWIKWQPTGWAFMLVYEIVYYTFWLYFALDKWMGFPWIAKIYLCLHGLVFWMKMYSYHTYNGYLWTISRELSFSQSCLKTMDEKIESGELTVSKNADPSDPHSVQNIRQDLIDSVSFCKFELGYQALATVITDNTAGVYEDVVTKIKEGKHSAIEFPNNITVKNFFDYLMYPTVVYTLNFPRTKRIRWSFFFGKVCGVFGVIALMIIVAQNNMYPLVFDALKAHTLPIHERAIAFGLIVLDMIPPMLIQYVFVFFLIWDLILNALAEITRYADRDFYGPWWSCNDFSDFARLWNKPIHNFLLRHVYHSLIATLQATKAQAGFITFLLLSVFHELVMYIIFHKFRGYLFMFQMFQIPLVLFAKLPFMKRSRAAGITLCWLGFMIGPALIMVLYLVF